MDLAHRLFYYLPSFWTKVRKNALVYVWICSLLTRMGKQSTDILTRFLTVLIDLMPAIKRTLTTRTLKFLSSRFIHLMNKKASDSLCRAESGLGLVLRVGWSLAGVCAIYESGSFHLGLYVFCTAIIAQTLDFCLRTTWLWSVSD